MSNKNEANLNNKENIAFRLRMRSRQKYEGFHLVNTEDNSFRPEKLGQHISFLPACLNPDASADERLANKRYVEV